MLGKRSTLVNKETEHKFEHLMYKITRFAMDFVRKEVSYGRIKANNNNIPSACECICNVIYKLPCYHMLAVHDVIPLSFVHPRWWIDYSTWYICLKCSIFNFFILFLNKMMKNLIATDSFPLLVAVIKTTAEVPM